MGEEEALLRSMVEDRNKRIALVKRKMSDLNDKQQRLLDELDAATEQSARQQINHQTEKRQLLYQQHVSLEELRQMEVDLRKQGSSLATYATMVTPNGTNDVDEHFVMRMQAQLCKAMHSMGILDHQLELLEKLGSETLKALRDVKTQQREAKSRLELSLLNELMASDNGRRTEEAEFKKELSNMQRQVKQLKKQVGSDEEDKRNSDDETERYDDDEEDEEVRKAKESLQDLLDQRKQQVQEMEQQLDEQEAELTRLRKKLGNDAVKAPEARPRSLEVKDSEEGDEDDEDEDDEEAQQEEQNRARDEMAARLHQVMENAKLEDVEKEAPMSELDLLRMAQHRLHNSASHLVDDEDEDDEESSDEDDEEDDEDDEQFDSGDEEGEGSERNNEHRVTGAAVAGSATRQTVAAMEEEEKKTADDDDAEDDVHANNVGGDHDDKTEDSDYDDEGSDEEEESTSRSDD